MKPKNSPYNFQFASGYSPGQSVYGKNFNVGFASMGANAMFQIHTDFSNYFTKPTEAWKGCKQVLEKRFFSDLPLTVLHKKSMSSKCCTIPEYGIISVLKVHSGNALEVQPFANVTAQNQQCSTRSLIIQSLGP